ncbi:hypothetical protein GPX89_17915 [Nocardia sp. ET3-3]|uniref:Uncharacterized protein n=1 Tax=Nocardia terrae TaxID=2675851 RepID=A0A7K1UXL4_9NOCA|nr:hypothetical protein [Nocardia terrae]MVU79114.1 hypothetical protein [Nocardia terrae]
MGRHPQRTPFYGVLMLIGAMLSGLWIRDWPWLWLRVVAFSALFVIACAGFLMTFRDLS